MSQQRLCHSFITVVFCVATSCILLPFSDAAEMRFQLSYQPVPPVELFSSISAGPPASRFERIANPAAFNSRPPPTVDDDDAPPPPPPVDSPRVASTYPPPPPPPPAPFLLTVPSALCLNPFSCCCCPHLVCACDQHHCRPQVGLLEEHAAIHTM
jgi:hypothetical protein